MPKASGVTRCVAAILVPRTERTRRLRHLRVGRHRGSVLAERHEQGANADLIAIGEDHSRRDPLVPMEGAILTTEVLEPGAVGGYHEARMATRHRRLIEPDLHVSVAPDDVRAD